MRIIRLTKTRLLREQDEERKIENPKKEFEAAVKSLKKRISKLKKSAEPEDKALMRECEELLLDLQKVEEILDNIHFCALKH